MAYSSAVQITTAMLLRWVGNKFHTVSGQLRGRKTIIVSEVKTDSILGKVCVHDSCWKDSNFRKLQDASASDITKQKEELQKKNVI